MSDDEASHVAALRANAAADPELQSLRAVMEVSSVPDDELLRFLIDCAPPFDPTEGLQALRVAARARAANITFPLPVPAEHLDAWRHIASYDGVTKDGERAFVVVLSRALQDALLDNPEPFLRALIGLMEVTRREIFAPGTMETVQTVVQVERGFRLNFKAVSDFTRATQRVVGALTDMYPSFTSRILVVNLPPYLAWFVKFVKGFLCEASAAKIELISEYDELLIHYDEANLPSYFRERGGIAP